MLNIPLVRDQLVKYSAITLQFKAQTVYKKWLELQYFSSRSWLQVKSPITGNE